MRPDEIKLIELIDSRTTANDRGRIGPAECGMGCNRTKGNQMSDFFCDVSEAIDATLRRHIDQRNQLTGEPRSELCVDAGKALVMLGCSFIGIGLGISDPDVGLQPGRECLKRFEAIADGDGLGCNH